MGWWDGYYPYHRCAEETLKVADDYDECGRCDGGVIRLC